VNLTLHERYGFRAIALGTALGAIANVLLLLGVFEVRQGGLLQGGSARSLVKMAVAAAAMAGALVPAAAWLETTFGSQGLGPQLATGLLPVLLGLLVYGGLSVLLRSPEASVLVDAVKQRLRRA
jgi:peptidoglycan biosynthesis protein MviN/MurJ (putative lipid II flippase)